MKTRQPAIGIMTVITTAMAFGIKFMAYKVSETAACHKHKTHIYEGIAEKGVTTSGWYRGPPVARGGQLIQYTAPGAGLWHNFISELCAPCLARVCSQSSVFFCRFIMILVHCTASRHGRAILGIFNDAILHSTALYEYRPRTLADIDAWFAAREEAGIPVLGMEDAQGTLAGFASFGSFRAYPAFGYTVEHSVYVHPDRRRLGVGRALMAALIEAVRAHGAHAMIGAIDAENAGSIALHEQFGFRHAGTLPQVGYKFGRWLDLVFYQLLLETPAHPVEG